MPRRGIRPLPEPRPSTTTISAEILFARNAEIKVVAPSLGDSVVENVLSPPEVPCAQEWQRAPDSRLGPARDADHGDRSPAAEQPTDRAQVSRDIARSAEPQALINPVVSVCSPD